MVRRVEYAGRVHEFPDDATDADIAAALEEVDQAPSRAAPRQRPPTLAERASPQQREAVARAAAQRQLARGAAPMGLGYVTQPLINTFTDPARRGELVRSAQGFVRDLQQVPNLDAGRLASDTAAAATQGVRNLPELAGEFVSNLPQIARGATYGPFVDEEAAQQRLDLARLLDDPESIQRAARDANTETAGVALNAAAPLVLGANPTVLRAAAAGAALDAPFALSRNSERPLQERLPNALTEMGGASLASGGMQSLVNAAPAVSRLLPSRGARMVERMDRAGASVDAQGNPTAPRGVTPSLAAANGGEGWTAPTTNLLADNIFVGGPTRGRLRRSATELRDAVHDVRDAYGRATSQEGAGQVVQRGLQRYATDSSIPSPQPNADPMQISTREWSFPSKARAVFDHALRPIEANPARLDNTTRVLAEIRRRADAPEVRAFLDDPTIAAAEDVVAQLQGSRTRAATLRDLREIRRKIRERRDTPALGQTVDNAALGLLEHALSQDMYAAAGGHARALQRADHFYEQGRRRIDETLRSFDPHNVDASRAIENILRAAAPKTGDTRALASLRQALRDDEWRVVAASIIDRMGQPTPGAAGFVAQNGFSVDRFATAYRNMTPTSRRILFGSMGGQGGSGMRTMRILAEDLDNLAEVALAQKGVERGANTSGSAVHLQNIGSLAGLVNPTSAGATLFGMAAALVGGELLTNPRVVRWLVSARSVQGAAGMRRHLALLRDLAARDPAVWPLYAELHSQLQAEQSRRGPGADDGQPAMRRPTAEPIR